MEDLPVQQIALPSLLYNLKDLTMMADSKVVKAMEGQLETFIEVIGITSVSGEDVSAYAEAIELLSSSVSSLGGNIEAYPEAFLAGLALATSNPTFSATMKQASIEAGSRSFQLIRSAPSGRTSSLWMI